MFHTTWSSPVISLGACALVIDLWQDPKSLVVYQYQTLVCGTFLILMNCMTCRVFRIVRLLKAEEISASQVDDMLNISTIRFRDAVQETE